MSAHPASYAMSAYVGSEQTRFTPILVLAMRRFLPLAACLTVCKSLCFIEELSTTPMKAYKILNNVESHRACVRKSENNAQVVSVAYSEETRVCHLQEPATVLMCNVPPFRRFVKTMTGCVGEDPGVTYTRTDLSKEHGVDPCVPAALLHPNPVLDATGATPPCQKRRITGTDGPVLYLRCLDKLGRYQSFGINENLKFEFKAQYNMFIIFYKNTAGIAMYPCISGFCAEENPGDSECCAPLPSYTFVPITNPGPPMLDTVGACPGQRLYTTVYNADPINFNGNAARIFCAGGKWLVGDDIIAGIGATFRIDSASCGN